LIVPSFLGGGAFYIFLLRQFMLMAAALMVAAPCILVFLLAQRYFVRGIVMSGVKG